MKNAFVLLLPLLMLIDYYLTLIGARLYGRKYGQHVRLEQYELNPLWQTSINQPRWFNPRHLLLVILITLLLLPLAGWGTGSVWFDLFLSGTLLTSFAFIIGRHLANILTFYVAIKQPEAIEGEVQMSHVMSLRASQHQLFILFVPLLLSTWVTKHPFLIGGVTAVLVLWLVHWLWLWRYRRQQSQSTA